MLLKVGLQCLHVGIPRLLGQELSASPVLRLLDVPAEAQRIKPRDACIRDLWRPSRPVVAPKHGATPRAARAGAVRAAAPGLEAAVAVEGAERGAAAVAVGISHHFLLSQMPRL